MNVETSNSSPRMKRPALAAAAVLVITAAIGVFQAVVPTPVQAATNNLTTSGPTANLQVKDATTGVPIAEFQYIINVDNTGTTEQRSPIDDCSPEAAGYPDSCNWTSMGVASSSPILTQGDQTDFVAGLSVPDGRYLISVLADGYKLDGAHFTMPLDEAAVVEVLMQAPPLPDATIQAAVFEDISPVNGAPDLPAEHGLAGWTGVVRDTLGEITTDVYGSPLCGSGVCLSYCYVVDGGVDIGIVEPADAVGRCPSISDQLAPGDPTGLLYTTDERPGAGSVYNQPVPATAAIEGKVKIPNLGTNRFTLVVTPPDGADFVQTTTLEGNHDWDAWIMEGATGLDTEFVVAGEPYPAIIFGYTPGQLAPLSGSGTITGIVDAVKVYVPANGGLPNGGQIWGGLNGGKIDGPIDRPYVALNDLNNGDTAVWVGRGDVNGQFTIPNVPDGNYMLTWWDEPQDYILDWQNVTVASGEVVDVGILPLAGWWTVYSGYVFNDANRNGTMDWTDTNGDGCPQANEGEVGVPNYGIVMRRRDNSLMDRGTTAVSTDACGYYFMESTYPMTQWLIMEAYNDLYYTTGVTYQADNQPDPTTVLGAGVDVSVLPIIGLSGTVDWGVHAYDARGTNGVDPMNGGIVGTVSYDTTRNELDPRFAAVEDWQPGVSGLNVELYAPVDCTDPLIETCDENELYQLDSTGGYMLGDLLNAAETETWTNPGADGNVNGDGNCVPRDVDGNPIAYPAGQQITNSATDCLEGPLMGMQFQQGYSAVDGNYGFGDGCQAPGTAPFDPDTGLCADGSDPADQALIGGRDYLVHVAVPDDAYGRPLVKFTREEDINIGNGDEFIPQVPPPACAGALHTVDVAGILPDGPDATVNPTFVEIGGSPYEGMSKPLCDTKLVPLANGRSIAPTFNVFTDVPLPGRFWGLLVDDLNFSSDPHQINFGEKSGIRFAPVGIYDYTNRLVYTAESDYSGLFDVLLPSTNRINCPTPSGVCGNVYRFVGNDPGTPGNLNANYKPEFRTIAAEFEAIPGVLIPADLAPTQVGVTVQLPGGQAVSVQCAQPATTPQLFAVDKPYVNDSGPFTIQGQGFGATTGQVTLDGTAIGITSWSDQTIVANVPASIPAGPHQLLVRAANGQTTVNGLTFHVLRGGLSPFPSTGGLDNFNRGNSLLTIGLGTNWSFALGYRVNGNTAEMRSGTSLALPEMWNTGFGASQEAYFTFTDISSTSNRQGLVLKFSNLFSNMSVFYDGSANVRVETVDLANGQVTQAIFPATFANGDILGARALADGTVLAYKNGAVIGSVNVTTTATPWAVAPGGNGQIGLTFTGTNNNAGNARIDNFGGGNYVPPVGPTYSPNLYEVGPGKPYATIQAAVNAAAASVGNDLVVVYPNTATVAFNPRGAYYENLIITTPVKLQGVGPGGIRGNQTVAGSIIDGGAFGGDSQTVIDWYNLIDTLTWDGNQNVSDGAVVTVLTHDGVFTNSFAGAVDGFDLRGGDQQGFPNNLNEIGGGNNGLPANVVTQGGAVFANAYARYLQITNNVVQNNGGSYGTIRIGTPDLGVGQNHNENVRIARNRIIANGGTNLAGGIGLFAESDNYVVADNDICGNFSAEYGGGISAYGLSPNGTIAHNRIWFNRSYDEGGGIMIAGSLPNNPSVLSTGSGPVTIRDNVIQSNLADDDGGGLRFLMAGNFPMNVFNNIIANNVSTHEGGGVGINDTPDVRFYNNTVMKNLTTATASTSNGLPAPAGLSTSANSALLEAALPGAPTFSEPRLFNNIFWDNRAGTRSTDTVVGIGAPGDATPIDVWDVGVADGTGVLAPTNSVISQNAGLHAYTVSPTNVSSNPNVIAAYDTQVSFNGWRTNPNFISAILVSVDLPPELLGNYHLAAGSPAINIGAASNPGTPAIAAPATDIDGQGRPQGGGFDAGADEVTGVAVPFPNTVVRDDFNRAGGLGANWNAPAGYSLDGALPNRTMRAAAIATGSQPARWAAIMGANQEVFFTFTDVSTPATEQALVLKWRSNSMIKVVYDRAASQVRVVTTTSAGAVTRATFTGITFAGGNTFGARTLADGTVTVFKNGAQIGTTNVTAGANPWPAALATADGRIGVLFVGTTATGAGDAHIDNFGGGTLP